MLLDVFADIFRRTPDTTGNVLNSASGGVERLTGGVISTMHASLDGGTSGIQRRVHIMGDSTGDILDGGAERVHGSGSIAADPTGDILSGTPCALSDSRSPLGCCLDSVPRGFHGGLSVLTSLVASGQTESGHRRNSN